MDWCIGDSIYSTKNGINYYSYLIIAPIWLPFHVLYARTPYTCVILHFYRLKVSHHLPHRSQPCQHPNRSQAKIHQCRSAKERRPLSTSFSSFFNVISIEPDSRALVTQCDTVLKRQKAANDVIEDDAGALKGHQLSSCRRATYGNVTTSSKE